MAVAVQRNKAPVKANPAPKPAVSGPVASPRTGQRSGSALLPRPVSPPALRLGPRPSPAATGIPDAIRGAVDSPGPGEPLPVQIQRSVARSYQVSLEDVQVHDDRRANAAALSLGARAFTYGRHIYLGPGESPSDAALMAHEAAHVVQQQQGAALQAKGGGGSGAFEAEADAASAAAGRGEAFSVAGRTGSATIQRQGEEKPWWRRGADWVGETAGSVLEFGESIGWRMLEQCAPQLVPILRRGPQGVFDWLKERASSALETLFDTLMAPVRAVAGVGRQLSGQFAPLLAWIKDAATKISKNDCGPLRQAAEKIEQTATRIVQPIIEKLQPVVAKIQSFFSGIWEKFGVPVWDWIKKVAGQQWAMIKDIASWIWEKAAPIRKLAAKAWTWLKNKIGIGEGAEGQNGILQWVQGKLAAAWDWLSVKLAPYKKEIAVIAGVVAGIALLVSPAGPVLVIAGMVVGVIQGVRWIKANWGKGIVQARSFVEKTLIPGLMGAAQKLTGKVSAVAGSVTAGLERFSAGLGRLVGAAASSALRFVVAAARWIAAEVNEIAQWARGKLTDLANWLAEALARLRVVGQRVADFLGAVGRVAADVYAIQGKILKKLWDLIPACLRDPVVDFLIPLIIRQIELFQELVRDNEAWQKTKKDVLNILRLVFESHDLKGALKAVFHLVLRVFNIPPELLTTIKEKAVSAWDVVSKSPLSFMKNLVRSIGHGFSLLWKNFRSHLAYGLERWLLGPLADKGIRAPSSWTDPKAVFGFVLDVMGLSVDHVFELLKKRFKPEAIDKLRALFAKIRTAWEWITSVIDTSKSPAENTRGVIEKAKGFAGSIFTGIAEWIIVKVGTELAAYATKAAASAGLSAVLDIFQSIYRALVTAKRWMRQILDMVNQALDDVLAVASGAIEVVGGKFEKLMHMGMPVVIGFLGDQVGLGDFPSKLRELITELRKKVDEAILWLIDKAKAGLELLVRGVKAAAKAILKWWKAEEAIPSSDGQKHRIFLEGNETNPKLTVASSPIAAGAAIELMKQAQVDPGKIKQAEAFKKTIDDAVTVLVAKNKALGSEATPGNKAADDDAISAQHSTMRAAMRGLAELLGEGLFGQVKFEDLEDTVITPKGAGGKAATIEAAPLSAKRPMGSAPGVAPTGWQAIVDEGLTDSSPHYVRLHLINENFGGAGNDVRNLVPGSKQNNSDHLRTAENQLKDLVGAAPGKSSGKFAQVWYKAEVSYRNEKATWKKVKYQKEGLEASDFAKTIRFTWGFYKRVNGKKWKKESQVVGNFTLGPIPLPDL